MPGVSAEKCTIVIDRRMHDRAGTILHPVAVDKPLDEVVALIMGLAQVLNPPESIWYVLPPGQKDSSWV